MNIEVELRKEKIHLRKDALRISAYACSSAARFKQLMQCFLSNEYRLAQRAAWSVNWAVQQKPELIYPYFEDITGLLSRTGVHNAVIRNTVRMLEKVQIPEAYHAAVMNACFAFVESPSTPVAIKAFSLTTLHNLSKTYPDIKPELKLVIEQSIPHETSAFKARGSKILKQLGN